MKIFKKLFIFFISFNSIFIIFNMSIKVNAYSNNVDILSEEFTNSDNYNYNNTEYSIHDYINNWNGYDIGRGAGYGQRNIAMGNSYRFDDNDIVNIIPKELFFEELSYHYIGKEYGFYISTELINGYYYRSNVAVYDINIASIDFTTNITTCTIQMIFNCWYDNYFRINGSPFSYSIIEGKDQVVTYLGTPQIKSEIITLKDIVVGVSLSNSDAPNPGDPDYVFKDNIRNKIIDKGDFITEQEVIVSPEIMPVENPYDLNWKEKLIMFGCKRIIEMTGVLTPLLWLDILSEFIQPDYEAYNTEYITSCNYGNGYEQLLLNDQLIRSAYVATSSYYTEYEPTFHVGNFVEITTKIDGSMDPEDRQNMNLEYNISVTVNDPKNGNECSANKEISLFYTKYMKSVETNEIFKGTLNAFDGSHLFYYYSTDNNAIKINLFADQVLSITVFENNGNEILNGSGSLIIDNPSEQSYIIKIEGVQDLDFLIAISKDTSLFQSLDYGTLRNIDLREGIKYFVVYFDDYIPKSYTLNIMTNEANNLSVTLMSLEKNSQVNINSSFNKYFIGRINMCYKEFYIVKVTNNNQNFRQITISIDESISTDQFLVSNYSNTINEEIDFDTNEIKEYIVSSTYQKNMK